MDEDHGADGPEDDRERYQLGPDGTPVGSGPDRSEPDPETAREHRQAARRALRDEDLDGAIDHLDRAVKLAEREDHDALAAGALTDRGNVRMERVDPQPEDPRAAPDAEAVREAVEAAIADYTAAIERDPDHGEAYFNRGLARARLGEREASTADLERAAELGSGTPFLVRGNAYAEAGADEAAREDFTRAIDRTDAAQAYFNRGNANRRLGDEGAAVDDYRAALDRADQLPDHGLRVLVELSEVVADSREAATQRVRAAFLAVAGRDIWYGVDLAAAVTADGPNAGGPWSDAGVLVLAGETLRETAGYSRDEALDEDVDVDAIRAALDRADLPPATDALFATITGGEADIDAVRERVPDDLAAAVANRDHEALRAAAAVELNRQLRMYQR
jgi:tetratricopeptide (TPR) repeat protein